jgi:hypothetical protein
MIIKSLVLNGTENVRSTNFVLIFNGLDWPFGLSNSRYGREAWEV